MTAPVESASTSGPRSHRRAGTGSLFSWAMFDWANSAFPTIIQTFVFSAYFTSRVAENPTTGTAQWGNAIGFAGLVVALSGPVLGAIADQAGRRKPGLGLFTLLCIVSTSLLWFVRPSPAFVVWGLLLVILATIGAECANISYNAMLPELASSERIGRWSGWGWALGYAGGLLSLALALMVFVDGDTAWFDLDRDQAEHVRATFLLAAGWFLVFALPLFLFTPDGVATGKRLKVAARDGVRQLFASIRQVRRYGDILRFLIARMIYIDGLATVFAFGGVYAAGTFGMSEKQVLQFGITLNVTAGVGAALFGWIDDWLGSRRTILISLVGVTVPTLLILFVGSAAWFWGLALVLGIFVGPVQAASRSFLSHAAPEPVRNQMFGLYAFSGKATSFLGPLLVGWATQLSGSQRIGMSTILLFFVVGFVLMLTVPAPKR